MALNSIRRVAELGKTARRAGKLAKIGSAAMALRGAEGELERAAAERALANLMADARGVPMKIGQFLAQGQDEDGAYSKLLGAPGSIEALPLEALREQIETSLGCPIEHVFSRLDESLAAASLGQVHRGVLHDGSEVAVKVRYPGIRDAIKAELTLAGLVPGLGPIRQWGFELNAYRELLSHDLERELDYRGEAERQARMREELAVPGLVIPKVYQDLCREDLLVQSWESGVSLAAFAARGSEDRVAAAQILVRTLFQSLFVAGEIHADPHQGNMFFRSAQDGSVELVLLDWGCTLSLERPRRQALLKLILASQQRDDIDLLRTFAAIGFDAKKLLPMESSLAALCPILFAPFLVEQRLNASTWQLGERLERLLGEHRWWFRAAGPADLLLILRAFQGLMQNLATLQIALPWRELLAEVVDEELCEEARRSVAEPLPKEVEARRRGRGFAALAKALKVQVLENGRPKIQISMPAEVGLDLETIVPDEVLTMVREEGVDLAALIEQVRQSGIAPQCLIDLDRPPKHYRVWLE